uniref:B30.2/SPRY domain-containing protein n=1 Tax=Astyanax mexicanus TaxID=7994 RepID=A0A3B1JMI2_ASTMX
RLLKLHQPPRLLKLHQPPCLLKLLKPPCLLKLLQSPYAPLVAVAGEVLVLPCSIQPNTSAVDMTVEWYRLDAADRFVHGDTNQNLPDNPERFTYYCNVLGSKGFSSGRFYYEVQVREKTDWTLGVARESINRKGKIKLTPQNGFWTVILRNENEYKACADSPVLLYLRENLQKVGVFVDYEEGLVSFYDVESRSHIYSFTGQSFTEKLYPFFSPEPNDGGKNSAPLIITPRVYRKINTGSFLLMIDTSCNQPGCLQESAEPGPPLVGKLQCMLSITHS